MHLHFVIPGDPATRTGGYAYDRRMAAGLRARGWRVDVHTLDASFPQPDARARAHAAQVFAALPDGAAVLVDGLAFGVLPDLADHAAPRLSLSALVHHPLALETGLAADDAARLADSERRALRSAGRVIVTSAATARALHGYDVAPARIAVVEPGTDPAPLARGSEGGPPALLCVAALVPRKGHDVLVAALAGLTERPWRMICVGSRGRDPAWAAAIAASIRAHGLDARIVLAGELDDAALAAHYDAADACVLATRHEGYGMALAEALARGLPVIATDAGAVPDTVPQDAGLLVPRDDPEALRAALARWQDDAALRARLAAGARRARTALPTWDDAVRRLAAALAA